MNRTLRTRRYGVVAVTSIALAAATVAVAGARGTGAVAAAPTPVITVASGSGHGVVDPMLFGGNGRWAYDNFGGSDPATHKAYPQYVAALQRSGITSVRYPGGTIANLYHWKQAIGPLAQRVDQVHGSTGEPLDNDFGPDEYGAMTDRLAQQGIMVVNFSTGTPAEAADWVEYMTGTVGQNRNGGIDWAARRAANGHPAPYDIRYWEIGNEMSLAGQYYWRGGQSTDDPVTLYARGGSASFTKQAVGTHSDYRDSAAISDGSAHQNFVVKYAPVIPGTDHLFVGDEEWTRTTDLAKAASGAHVYTLAYGSGTIRFGDGRHGAVPAADAKITTSYTSGPHPGFEAFYRAMKQASPQAQVCAGLSGVAANQQFAQLMGSTHPYDCVEQHAYVSGPADTTLPTDDYYGRLLGQRPIQVDAIRQIQDAITQYAVPRAKDIDVVASEYGQLGNGHPTADPDFHASLSQAIFMSSDLAAFIDLGLPVADKSNLTDYVNEPAPGGSTAVGAPLNAIIAGPGPHFQIAPTGLVPKVFGPLAKGTALTTSVADNPTASVDTLAPLASLVTVAARHDDGRLELVVVNQDPHVAVSARVDPGQAHGARATFATLNGPSIESRNTPGSTQVQISATHAAVGSGSFMHAFPPHSITRIELTAAAG